MREDTVIMENKGYETGRDLSAQDVTKQSKYTARNYCFRSPYFKLLSQNAGRELRGEGNKSGMHGVRIVTCGVRTKLGRKVVVGTGLGETSATRSLDG